MKRLKVEDIAQLHRPAKGLRLCKWVKSNPIWIDQIYGVDMETSFVLMGDESIDFKAKDISLMSPAATFSTPFGKMNDFVIECPIETIKKGNWTQKPEEFEQATLFD